MDFDDTLAVPDEAAETDERLAAQLREAAEDDLHSFAVRHEKARVAAALFDEPITPTKIGRFTIVRELGTGGMGVVYVAYDEQLDRRVAVKLLRRADTDTQGRARLEREAQAMARLSHPNVITVHEVGTYRDQIFVAMEFIAGGDLRAWLGQERRPWREIVAVFRQAGEGLAAAHGAGIAHRDFKPDNVLIGEDGRVRVADFGLAHALDVALVDAHATEPEPESELLTESNSRLDRPLTLTGALMGTPAYMAPEQFAGRSDTHSDQFAFCVALWEGLYGRRPFSGTNLGELARAIATGQIVAPPEDSDVPAWLRAAIVRGLSPKPSDRWPSMRALLDVLANDPEARRRRRMRITALASTAIVVIAGLAMLAAAQLRENARRRYWSTLTEQLLEIERVRGFRQATDDARRARDATRMSVYRSYRPRAGLVDHEDPTVAAVLLREVEGPTRRSEAWISAANEILGQPLSHAVLGGHRDVVTALVFAPDEPVIYSAASDGEVWRWDLTTGAGRPIIVHDEDKEVTGLALSPDGATVVSASRDRTVRVWTAAGGARILADHEGELTDVAFAPDGQRVVTASRDKTAAILELDGGRRVDLRGHRKGLFTARFDPSGEQVLTGSADHEARLWRASDGELLATLVGHDQPIFHVGFVDAELAITGADDGAVRRWDLRDEMALGSELLGRHGAPVTAVAIHEREIASAAVDGHVALVTADDPSSWRIIDTHAKDVWSVAFTPDGAGLISASFDTSARLHDLRGGAPSRSFVGHRLALLTAAIDPSGRWLATGAYDGEVRIWDLSRPVLETTLVGHRAYVDTVAIDHAGTRVVTASHDGSARVWSLADGRPIARLAGGHEAVYDAKFSPDGRLIATATYADTVELWDLDTLELTALRGHTRRIEAVDFDPDGTRLGSASQDGTARIWSLTGEELLTLNHGGRVMAIDFGGPGRPLATAGFDGVLRLWDPADGREQAILRGHQGVILALDRSTDGVLVTGSDDGTARLWPNGDSAQSIVLAGHTKPVWSVSFDAAGTRVVTTSHDATARVWDARDGALLATLSGHAEGLWGARFVGTDRVATISNDKTVRIWSLLDDTPPIVLSGHKDAIMDLAVSLDGSRLITASNDFTAKIWRLDRLLNDPERLLAELRAVTIFCLAVEQRVRELGEAEDEAQAAFVTCERDFGR